MKNTMSMFAILGAAMLSACASKNGGGAAVQKPEIADKLNKLPNGTTFATGTHIFELVKEGGKWQYKFNKAGKEVLFAADDFMKDGDFDVSKSAKLEDSGEEFNLRLKVAHSDLTYANYGMLETTKDGSAIKDYDFFFAGQVGKDAVYQKNTSKATKFSGKTYASLTTRNGGNILENKLLSGTADLTVGANSTQGDLKFTYKNWGNITAKNFNLTTGQATSWEGSGDFQPLPGSGEVKSKVFNNDELVGTYKLTLNDSSTTNDYQLKGVFGMKGKVQD